MSNQSERPLTYRRIAKLFDEHNQALAKLTDFFGTDDKGRKALHDWIDAVLDAS